ncbi:hypothetical protein [Nocardioides alcanivorans]|uniref:hypothetical protein n=1 Tax=Nocardioides alcanivorans TaxID=2897352 RepID=UPI001F47B3B0|nr:hypothetical protein [Nocardioides alcanivorans]
MASRVVLHIGLMKSGTSYLQARLLANHEQLAGRGIFYPTPWQRQVSAVKQLIGRDRIGLAPAAGWEKLAADITKHQGSVLLSMEFLAAAAPGTSSALRTTSPPPATHASTW